MAVWSGIGKTLTQRRDKEIQNGTASATPAGLADQIAGLLPVQAINNRPVEDATKLINTAAAAKKIVIDAEADAERKRLNAFYYGVGIVLFDLVAVLGALALVAMWALHSTAVARGLHVPWIKLGSIWAGVTTISGAIALALKKRSGPQ